MVEQGTSLGIVDPNCAAGPDRTITPWVFSVGLLMVIAGCSTAPAPLQPVDSPALSTAPREASEPEPPTASSPGKSGAAASGSSDRDEFFDPFAKSDGPAADEYDPWEPFNSTMFEFNRKVDRFVLKPLAQGYDFVVPNAAQIGVSKFFSNLRFMPRFMNNLFQGKVTGAGVEMGRFLVNSTLGVAGFLDIATHMNLQTSEEDTGQTLGFYGVTPGPYLVLPLMPPFSLRDGIGYTVDLFLDPINWLVLPLIEVKGVPSAIAHKNRTTTSMIRLGRQVEEVTNDRSLNLEKFQGVEEATLDLYAAVRNAYLQKRAKAVRE
ncbi:MAG: VacJ family lipoprotein [Nitrospira sp.]|nr:VacJ family lipoprotein [Nitrospira sp.]